MLMNTRILRWREVSPIIGCSRMTIARMEKAGTFPQRTRIGNGSVGWLEHEVEAWLTLRETLTAGQGAALHLIHHNRKPMAGNSHQAGDLYAAHGASTMQGEAHFVFTLADMDAESQRQFGIDDDKKGFYVRLDDAKSKMAPPAGAKWFERHGEALRRSDGNLEQIGILKPWLPPDFRLDITEQQRV